MLQLCLCLCQISIFFFYFQCDLMLQSINFTFNTFLWHQIIDVLFEQKKLLFFFLSSCCCSYSLLCVQRHVFEIWQKGFVSFFVYWLTQLQHISKYKFIIIIIWCEKINNAVLKGYFWEVKYLFSFLLLKKLFSRLHSIEFLPFECVIFISIKACNSSQ